MTEGWLVTGLGRVVALTLMIVALVPASGIDAQSPASATASPAIGCGGDASAVTASLSVAFGGRSRTVLVNLPRTGAGPFPLVLNLHGSQSTAAEQEAFSGMDAIANDFIVAYPQAAIPSGTGFDWNVPGADLAGGQAVPKNAPDDVAFLKALVGDLEGRYCIDPRRVYATGFSSGGRMTSQLACDAADLFAAFAPVSGLRFPATCQPARPVALLAFHGEADPIDPYAGNGEPYWTYSVPEAARRWAGIERCATTPVVSTPVSEVTETTYSGCQPGASIALYAIAGLGHEWPGGPAMPKRVTHSLGPQSNAINANSVMWAFFASHALAAS